MSIKPPYYIYMISKNKSLLPYLHFFRKFKNPRNTTDITLSLIIVNSCGLDFVNATEIIESIYLLLLLILTI